MNRKVTIVLYHYVRDLKNSRYPKIKGLDVDLFKEQILYLKKHYNIITMEQLISSVENDEELPPKSVLLTFDDAYSDHYTNVFPVLVENSIQGSFFPPAKAIKERVVLDVNKIHHILASHMGTDEIIAEIYSQLDIYRDRYNCGSGAFYYSKYAVADRFDTADVIFIKRLLQQGLDEELRGIITRSLFEKCVGMSESAFAGELYMNMDQIKIMKNLGMHIGAHGFDHYWLDSLPIEQQDVEVSRSLDFLGEIGVDMENWTMAYPYGGYNDDTIELMRKYDCKLAFTIEMGIADVCKKNRFTLARLDTNDIPKDRSSEVNEWYAFG